MLSYTARPLFLKKLYTIYPPLKEEERKGRKEGKKLFKKEKKTNREKVTAKEILNDKIKTASYHMYSTGTSRNKRALSTQEQNSTELCKQKLINAHSTMSESLRGSGGCDGICIPISWDFPYIQRVISKANDHE